MLIIHIIELPAKQLVPLTVLDPIIYHGFESYDASPFSHYQ
jgi:hypothetical protein